MATLAKLMAELGLDEEAMTMGVERMSAKVKALGPTFERMGKELTAGITGPILEAAGVQDESKENAMNDQTQFMTIKQVQWECQLARSTVVELLKSGALPAVKFWKAVRIPRKDFERFLQDRAFPTKQPKPKGGDDGPVSIGTLD